MSNAGWGQDGSSNVQAPRRKANKGGIVVLVIGTIIALIGGIWKVVQSFGDTVVANVTEDGNQFSAADISLALIVVGFAILLIGAFAINKGNRNRR